MRRRTSHRMSASGSLALSESDDMRRQQTQLRSEAFLAQAQRLTKTGSIWWRPSTGEVAWSEETYRLLGYSLGVAPRVERALQRCHPDDLPMVSDRLAAAVRDGLGLDFEHRLLMPGGTVKFVRVVFQNVAPPGAPVEFLGAVTDITERKQADDRLRYSEEVLGALRSEISRASRVTALGTLTASIAHEVNQPLCAILTNTGMCNRLLSTEAPNLERVRELVRRISRDANRANEVILRLRALFARKPPMLEEVDLNEATRKVVALSRGELRKAHVALRLELAERLPTVLGDRVQLQQVIANLLRNAIDAVQGVPDGRRDIVLTTTHDLDDSVRFCVRDSGVGFGSQDTEKLFEAFYTTKADGMGIGLSVSRSIIEGHHGRLWAVANHGVGTTFSFSIPRDRQDGKDGMRRFA